MRGLWISFVVASAAHAGPTKDTPKPAELDDPCVDTTCTHRALDAFRAALAAQKAGTASHALRVSYFGDSVTADDHLTNGLRQRLQALVGNGGPGFVFAAPPHPFNQHRAIARTVSDGWVSYGISTVVPPDHLLGLGGSAETDGGGTIRIAPTAAVQSASSGFAGARSGAQRSAVSIDVHYLVQPHGGRLDVAADGKVIATAETGGDHKQGAFLAAALPEGAKHLELRAHGRVRLFGATIEANTGAVVDNLGVVNATAKAMRQNDLDDHLRNQLAHRAPDLVVVMYGTNEAEWLHAPPCHHDRGGALRCVASPGMAEHEQLFGELLATMRAADPDASCLVVSPLDQLDWRDDKMPPRDSIPAMVEAQRRAAAAHGCAFWDVYAWMGGRGSSAHWHARGWLARDYQHPTTEGDDRLAEALYEGLVSASN